MLVGTTTSGMIQKTIQSIDSIDSTQRTKEDVLSMRSHLPELKLLKMKMIPIHVLSKLSLET